VERKNPSFYAGWTLQDLAGSFEHFGVRHHPVLLAARIWTGHFLSS
jgi:hypothetical protein